MKIEKEINEELTELLSAAKAVFHKYNSEDTLNNLPLSYEVERLGHAIGLFVSSEPDFGCCNSTSYLTL